MGRTSLHDEVNRRMLLLAFVLSAYLFVLSLVGVSR